jgi:pimeloyl-ACP methyl ester carboxylesterase
MVSGGYVEVGGVRIRYLESGRGIPLVHLPGAGELRLTPAHELLAGRFRVLVVGLPDGSSPDALSQATTRLGLERFDLMATSRGAEAALRLALAKPGRVRALVLEAPTAIRPEDRGGDLAGRLPDLAAPTLVLLGTRDDVVPPAMARLYKERIPACHLVFVYDAAHAISRDRPEAFAEVVGDFLERHDAFVISRAQTVIHP